MSNVQPIPTTIAPSVFPIGNAPSSYDAIPYASFPVAASHPDRMFSMARLFGLNPVPPEHARILELGCAGGGNLLPIASQFPRATCVGVEIAQNQCNDANTAIKFVGLKNIEVRQASISDIDQSIGKFDYIICHGVFSWVPEAVRNDILRVSRENLSNNGVAYISYNVLPGWYMRGMVRAMMLQHVNRIDDSVSKIVQARALLKFLVESTSTHDTPYASYLRTEAEFLDKLPDHYLFHEHLEEFNTAFFFQDFVRSAHQHGLQFLGESSLSSMWSGNFSPEVVKTLDTISDSILKGHYMDCLVGRTFRETLLVPSDVAVDRNLVGERLDGIRFAGTFTEEPATASGTNDPKSAQKRYKTRLGATIIATELPSQIVIDRLTEAFPGSLSVVELCEAIESVWRKSGTETKMLPPRLATFLMQWALAGHIEFTFSPDRMTTHGYSKPIVTDWARCQARAGQLVTNLRHEVNTVSDVHRQIIPLLDGTRDMQAIAKEIHLLICSGILGIPEIEDGKMRTEATAIRVADQIVSQLARRALLLA
jgi:methyltransferase-like protein/2-polyprenyl-3-methyl-5-hydroxy-6-metoxy-1,4-benzoquinol methylase